MFWQSNTSARKRGKLTMLVAKPKDLKIETICANSPQAKDWMELGFGMHQDQSVKEMRLASISYSF